MGKEFNRVAKPIIPWMGGKTKLLKNLLPHLPEHGCYVEPFAGSAAVFFAKEPSKCEVLNDINGELMNLYRVVQHHLEAFLDHFTWLLSSREQFTRAQETNVDHLTDIGRAVRFFYLQKHAFGGQTHNQSFGCSTTSKPRFGTHSMIKTLQEAHERLKGALIENQSWQQVIDRYDRPFTLFYCDPPYWKTAGYGAEFAWEQYQQLKYKMESIKGKMIISINDHPEIRRLFKGFKMKQLSVTYSAGTKNTQAKELLIFNENAATGALQSGSDSSK